MTTLHISVPRPLLINSNHRLHWAAKSRRTRDLRTLGRVAAIHLRRPQLTGPLDATWTLRFTDKRHRDPANFHLTCKALLDGVVDSGLLPADDSRVIASERYELGDPHVIAGRVLVDLTLTERTPA